MMQTTEQFSKAKKATGVAMETCAKPPPPKGNPQP
jgi:hypothetical protein